MDIAKLVTDKFLASLPWQFCDPLVINTQCRVISSLHFQNLANLKHTRQAMKISGG